jgi:hypothetical protein
LAHNCLHSDEVTTNDSDSDREQVEVTENTPELNSAGISAGTCARHFHNSMPHSRLGMEPMAGIERFMLYFQFQKYDISPINASTFALLLTFPNEPITYPLTEGFTETFTEGFSAHARI